MSVGPTLMIAGKLDRLSEYRHLPSSATPICSENAGSRILRAFTLSPMYDTGDFDGGGFDACGFDSPTVDPHGAWLDQDLNRPTSGSTKRRNRSRIGRNEPCPCGSGKKFKRCCIGTFRTRYSKQFIGISLFLAFLILSFYLAGLVWG